MENKVFLFPLRNSLLFKKVTLPYHIFESRYLKMIEDSIAMQIPIAILPSHDSNLYRGEICVAGMPHILSTYSNRQMDIYITGSVKCRLTDLDSDDPYLAYRYREVKEDLSTDDTFQMELESLKTFLERWATHFLPDRVQREVFSNTLGDPELLVNYCAVFLVDQLYVKKEVLLAGSLKEKIRLILQVIGPKEVSLGPFMPKLKF